MELQLKNELKVIDKIDFNEKELLELVENNIQKYKNVVYTDETMKEAKKDRATLNKASRQLNDIRLDIQREYMRPITEFKTKVDNIISLITTTKSDIDDQIKTYESERDTKKQNDINMIIEYQLKDKEYQNTINKELFIKDNYMNISCKLDTIRKEIQDTIARIDKEIQLGTAICSGYKDKETALIIFKKAYLQNLDLTSASEETTTRMEDLKEIEEKKRQAQVKAVEEENKRIEQENERIRQENERKKEELKALEELKKTLSEEEQKDFKIEQPVLEKLQEKVLQINLQIVGTKEQLLSLQKFCKDNQIKVKKLK